MIFCGILYLDCKRVRQTKPWLTVYAIVSVYSMLITIIIQYMRFSTVDKTFSISFSLLSCPPHEVGKMFGGAVRTVTLTGVK